MGWKAILILCVGFSLGFDNNIISPLPVSHSHFPSFPSVSAKLLNCENKIVSKSVKMCLTVLIITVGSV